MSKETDFKSRCCGRCDGNSDECVADMVCEEHKRQGCEKCYGSRNPVLYEAVSLLRAFQHLDSSIKDFVTRYDYLENNE
jgi:hypothetical protein